MAFEDALEEVAEKAREYAGNLLTEEATKTAIVMPFISRVLGYDVFNPDEVVPEFVCDVGIKKGEKIDYAITREGQVQMLIEAKKIGEPLKLEHSSQLVRYFSVSNARIGVLTNGQHWHFYTDLDKPNVMDAAPFLRLNLLDIDGYALPELKKLTKAAFDLDSVVAAAEELKYVSAIKAEIAEQFHEPSDEFVRLFASKVYTGTFTARMRDFFRGVTEKATRQFVNDRVNDRLKSALGGDAGRVPAAPSIEDPEVPTGAVAAEQESRSEIETTEEELQGFMIVRAIAASEVPLNRVFARDSKSYFAINLDDNNRKPVCRLHFNQKSKRYIGLLDENKVETRHELHAIEDIYTHAEDIREAVRRYAG